MKRSSFREQTNALQPDTRICVTRIDPMPITRDAASKKQAGKYVGRTTTHLLMVSDAGENLSHFHTCIEKIEIR